MSIGHAPFSPGAGYYSPAGSVGVDADMFKITLTRRLDRSFQWSPEYGTLAWENALNYNFPGDSTMEQKMQMAVAKKIREEIAEQEMYNPNFTGVQTTTLQRPSFSSGTTLNTLSAPSPSFMEPVLQKTITPPKVERKANSGRPELGTHKSGSSGAGRKTKLPGYGEGQSMFASKPGAPITKGRKGPLSEKQKADAKKNRKEKSVCKEHRKARTKCDPEICPNNWLYIKAHAGGHIRTQSDNSRPNDALHQTPQAGAHSRTQSDVSRPSFEVPSMEGPSPGPTVSDYPRTSAANSNYNGSPPPPFVPNFTYPQYSPSMPGFTGASPPMTLPGPNNHMGFMAPPQIRGSAPSSIADPNLAMTSEFIYDNKFSPDMSLPQTATPINHTPNHPTVESLARDPVLFPNNGASNQNPSDIPRQDSYNSNGSAAEYFLSDDLPPVSEEMFHFRISTDVMRDMERIEDSFGHGDSRSIHEGKKSTKRWWVSERLRRVVRYVYTGKVFRRNRKNRNVSVQTVEVEGTVEVREERIQNSAPQQEAIRNEARRTESTPVLMMVTSSDGIVQEPEHYHNPRNHHTRRATEPTPTKQEERKDSKMIEDASSGEETVLTKTTIRVKSESKESTHKISEEEEAAVHHMVADIIASAHKISEGKEAQAHDMMADIIADTNNLKLEQEKERSRESIITVKAGAIVV